MTKHRRGDVREEDGYIFTGRYWFSPQSYFRLSVGHAHASARTRARKKDVPFDLSIDYLLLIYPEDGLCPVFKTPMIWGDASGRMTSPSLDRIVPEKGYVVGNVIWISNKANTIKSFATTDELLRVAEFMKETASDDHHQ